MGSSLGRNGQHPILYGLAVPGTELAILFNLHGVSKKGFAAHMLFVGDVAHNIDFIFSFTGPCQIIRSLHLGPGIRRTPECLLQTNSHFRRDTCFVIQDSRKGLTGNAQNLGRFRYRQS